MIKIIAIIFFIGSVLAFGIGTLGLFRFRDSYTRMHGVGVGDTLGVGLMGIGLLLICPSWILRFKIIFILLLFWIINPTMSHLIAKSAVMNGTKPKKNTRIRKE